MASPDNARHGAGRRIVVLLVGLVLIAAGVVLLVLPGPGLLLILAGVGVLATEFELARRAHRRMLVKAAQTSSRLRGAEGPQNVAIPPSQHAQAHGGIEPPLHPPH